MKNIFLLFLFTSIALAGGSQLEMLLEGQDATMVIYDENEQNYLILNEGRATERFSPFSTHKVPHSLIALETGLVPNIDSLLSWDQDRYPKQDWWPKSWEGSHNLRSAIKVSLVPAYREMARQAGEETMRTYLKKFQFGNSDVSSGLDSYWLNGSLKISAMEQVKFMERFFNHQFRLKLSTTLAVREIMVREETDVYTFSHKTGTGTIDQETEKAIAWLVGYIERDKNVYFFAFNMDAENFNEAVEKRMELATEILAKAGLIDKKSP